MLEQTVFKLFDVLPMGLKKRLAPSYFEISEFVEGAARQIPENALVLDAGAGQCQHRPLFKRHRYIAVDAALGDINWNYSKLSAIGDLVRMPFREHTFDAIICTQVLEHIYEPGRFFSESFRILKPGGRLFLSAPQGWCVHQAPHDYFRFTSYGLQYLFHKAGFKITCIKPSCGYFGYMANRLTFLPQVVFRPVENPVSRVLLSPLELIAYLVFVLILPPVFHSMDFLDKRRDFTLNYLAQAEKPAQTA